MHCLPALHLHSLIGAALTLVVLHPPVFTSLPFVYPSAPLCLCAPNALPSLFRRSSRRSPPSVRRRWRRKPRRRGGLAAAASAASSTTAPVPCRPSRARRTASRTACSAPP